MARVRVGPERGADADLRGLGSVPKEERPRLGAAANSAKTVLEEHLTEREQELRSAHLADVRRAGEYRRDAPRVAVPQGRLHPTTRMMREMTSTFASMGFQAEEGPEIELDRYNFDLLNIPSDHPARDMFDTCGSTRWTSMATTRCSCEPTLRRCRRGSWKRRVHRLGLSFRQGYRYEATDATHDWHFHQVEGLAVDKGITFADLKGRCTSLHDAPSARTGRYAFGATSSRSSSRGWIWRSRTSKTPRRASGPSIATRTGSRSLAPEWCIPVSWRSRLRPCRCTLALRSVSESSGVAMLKYGIDDVRLFYSNDIRFLQQV